MQREDVGDPSGTSLHPVFLPQNAVEKRKTRFKDLHCTSYLATAIIVATVKLTSTSAWTEHCPSWFQGCTHTVLLQTQRPMEASEALLHCCRGTVGTVGLSDVLSDCRTVGRCASVLTEESLSDTVGQLSDTVGLSDCRTVGLSENCRNHCRTVGPGLSANHAGPPTLQPRSAAAC